MSAATLEILYQHHPLLDILPRYRLHAGFSFRGSPYRFGKLRHCFNPALEILHYCYSIVVLEADVNWVLVTIGIGMVSTYCLYRLPCSVQGQIVK